MRRRRGPRRQATGRPGNVTTSPNADIGVRAKLLIIGPQTGPSYGRPLHPARARWWAYVLLRQGAEGASFEAAARVSRHCRDRASAFRTSLRDHTGEERA